MKAKKYWGQNFLTDQAIVKKILSSADIKPSDEILEIGPGQGILTFSLAKKSGGVIAVEIDPELIFILRKKKSVDINNLLLVQDDILRINLPELLKDNFKNPEKYKVIANIPYYITGPILRLLLETELPPSEIILMVQKEVAERIITGEGEMSILSVSVQYYGDAEILFSVPRESFSPQPKIDSAVIKISLNKRQRATLKNKSKEFFRLVRAGFSSKRKTLANNLSASLHLEKEAIEKTLLELGFNKKIRAQELSVENWKTIADNMR